ncbi:helix-turn-helix domain-containing protein [Candidatus Venteria ishoeyi]|uniref:Helix-turn-helix n=1 Tax=Candidatus Venteria ishoeyi TaxID=1899563 RepID=A0A1H6FCD9_9GAMM|nr:helix-turn-helix domain-containing protein [Candidatus Venteria ishoeyi]SEH06989.1 Helix-turn-helix [Candidatus Venteria ishoeyi]
MELTLENVLPRLIRKSGLKDIELAQKIGVSKAAISQWKKGAVQHPDYNHMIKLAQALSLDTADTSLLLHSAGYKMVKEPRWSDNHPVVMVYQTVPTTTTSIRRPVDFFGRTRVLEEIFDAWNRPVFEHIAITGGKRSGKTSLLNYLRDIHHATRLRAKQYRDWLSEDLQWVYVDFRYAKTLSLEKLLRHILAELSLPAPDACDLDHFTEIIEDQLTAPAIILMDDIEFGLESEALDQRFWNTMRHLASSPAGKRIGFCITSRQAPAQLEARAAELGKPSPFFNVFERKTLGALSPEEAEEFLTHMGITDEDSIWFIDKLGTWPVVLQECCKIRLNAQKYEEQNWQADCLALKETYAYLFS